MNSQIYLEAAKIFSYTALSFLIALWWAPMLIRLLVWLRFWKKKSRSVDMDGNKLDATADFYSKDEAALKVPRAGGLLIWITALGVAFGFWFLFKLDPTNDLFQFLNFVDRRKTFIPMGTLFFAALVGFADDVLATLEDGGNYLAGGLKLSYRLFFVTIMSLVIGLWFHLRLVEQPLHEFTLPFGSFNGSSINWIVVNLDQIQLFGQPSGWLIVPLTVIVMLALWGSSMIDGFDGMSAGVFIPIYLCFAGLAFARSSYNIAAFLMVIVGALAAYLWFNIPPAKFYMGDTGTMPLLMTLGVVAFLLDALYVLPIAGIILVLTEGSVILQLLSKKLFKKKLFLAAPLHHHLEAKGWLRHQVTMRYWLISIMGSVLGLAVGLLVYYT